MYIPNPVPEGHTETLQFTVIPQVLAWYIQYQHIHSTDIYSPNGWKHISNTNIYFHKCPFPTLCPKGIQKPYNLQSSPKCWHDISNINIYIQLTYSPQMVGSIYPIQIYIFINVHSKPCARRAHRNPSTYSHPLSVGMIYPISTNINKLLVHKCVRLTSRAQRVPATRIELGFFCTTRTLLGNFWKMTE